MNSQADLKLSRSRRIANRKDILACQENGRKFHTKHFLIFCLLNDRAESRFAVTVTTKIDKRSAVRNKIRRRLKEIFRVFRSRLANNFDMVVLVRRGGELLSLKQVEGEIVEILESKGILKTAN